jgi:SAM-dependent methyltransferase
VTQPGQPGTRFEPEDFSLSYPPGIEDHYWTAARNQIIERQLKVVGLRKPRILEIGCGTGVVVAYLRRRGYECHGVEPAQAPVRESVRDCVFTGMSAADIPAAQRRSFDTLLLLDVLEHLPAPVEFLAETTAAFPNASHLILTVPARQELWSNYDSFFRHYCRYDLKSLGAVVRGMGGTVLRMKYFFHLLYLPGLFVVGLRGRRNIRISAPRTGWKLVHRLVSKVCVADYHLVPGRVYGTSIVCVAGLGRRAATVGGETPHPGAD